MKKILIIFLVFIFAFSFLPVAYAVGVVSGSGWLDGWTYRKKITISQPNSDLTDFPLLVKISDDLDLGKNVSSPADGGDIRFTDSDGITPLTYEKEDFSISKNLANGDFWVKIPAISSKETTDIYIYYGNVAPSSPLPSFNVWDPNYIGVWHLNDLTGIDALDSTMNGNDLTNSGGINGLGEIGNGFETDGTASRTLSRAMLKNFSGAIYTIETWQNGLTTTDNSVAVSVGNGTGSTYWSGGEVSSGNYVISNGTENATSSQALGSGWHLVAGVKEGMFITGFLDGISFGSESIGPLSSNKITIGDYAPGYVDHNYKYSGTIDEVRVSNITRSVDWLKFESDNILSGDINFDKEEIQTDTTPPVISIINPPDGFTSLGSTVTFEANATDTNPNFIVPNLDNSLVSWWRMDDLDGKTGSPNDYTANTNNLTAYGSATATSEGKFGKAFVFDGSGSYLKTTNKLAPSANGITQCAWIKPTDVNDNSIMGFSNGYDNSVVDRNLFINSGGNLSYYVNNNKANVFVTSTTTLTSGVWYFVCGMMDANTGSSVWVNGNQENINSSGGRGINNYKSPYFFIGAKNPFDGKGKSLEIGGHDFNGVIDEVTLFNRTLTDDEIKALYDGTAIAHNAILPEGSHTYKLFASDSAGNVGVSTLNNFTVPPIFSVGDGLSADTAYQVSNCTQLQTIGSDVKYLDKYFKQMGPIDCSATGISDPLNPSYDANLYNSGFGFTPIGDDTNNFSGGYNGNGYTIDGLTINNPSKNYSGLFGFNIGEISNVGLTNVNISSGVNSGGIAGENDGTINNSYTSGIINSNSSYVGGLAGINGNGGVINNSYSGVTVAGYDHVGGLVGENDSDINASYSTGSVSSTDVYAGGFTAYNTGSISNSYSKANVSASDYVGGFIGINAGTITNSYSVGTISGSDSGGFDGFENGTTQNSFWDLENSLAENSSGSEIGNSTISMKDSSVFINAGWDFNGLWKIDPLVNDGYPSFIYQGLNGKGTIDNPWQITNINELQFARYALSDSFILNNDISASSTSDWSNDIASGFTPIGLDPTGFSGSFNGNNHVVDGLTINHVVNFAGLFGYNNKGVINNIGLTNLNIASASSDFYPVGGLVGFNVDGSISNSYTTGNINIPNSDYVGGLVGFNNSGSINSSYSNVEVSGNTYTGGFAGGNGDSGTISNSYSTGNVTGNIQVGGFTGFNNNVISNSYSTGSVAGGSDMIGGFVGQDTASVGIGSSFSVSSVTTNDGATNVGGFAGSGSVSYDYSTKNDYWFSSSTSIAIGDKEDVVVKADSPDYFKSADYSSIPPMSSWDFPGTWVANAGFYPTLLSISADNPHVNTAPVASFEYTPEQRNNAQLAVYTFVSDVDANDVSLSVEYSLDGGDTWNNANSLTDNNVGNVTDNTISGITTNGTDTQEVSFDWNFADDGVTDLNSNILLRITPNDGIVSGDSVVSDLFSVTYYAPAVITSLSPENNSTDVATNTSFVITFDKAINFGSGYISIKNSSDGSPFGGPINVNSDQVSGNETDTVVISPSVQLLNNTSYYIEIDPSAFLYLDSIPFAGITDNTTWTFTTSVASTTVTSTSTPIITLLGSPHLVIYQGQAYSDAGVTAYDSIDHDISGLVSSSTGLNTSNIGTYTITYNVTNSTLVPAVPVTRIVKVIPLSSETSLIDNEGDSEIRNTDIFIPKEVETPKLDLSAFQSEAGTSTTANVTKDITITRTMPSGDDIVVTISSSTVLTSSSTIWNGLINLPQPTTNPTISPSGGKIISTSSAVEIGLGNTSLVFDKGVRILFKNAGSKLVGYSSEGGPFVKITNICNGDIPSDSDCKISINNGNDLVVWTKHFTTYVVYSESTIPVLNNNVISNSGGGGGGGGAWVSLTKIAAPVATTTVPIVSTSTLPVATSSQKQLVLTPSVKISYSPKECTPYITSFIEYGTKNSPDEVRKLQVFLNMYEGEKLIVDGMYKKADVLAVKRFQQKHKDVLAFWNLSKPTGYVYVATQKAINRVYCERLNNFTCPYFKNYADPDEISAEVPKIKTFLNNTQSEKLDITSSLFDSNLFYAIKRFQTKYKKDILTPWKLKSGSGRWYQSTLKKANDILGCFAPVRLDNGKVVE